MQSIRQNDLPDALPDFRNLGVISRVLLSVNALALVFALARSREIGEFAARVTEIAAQLEPVLLAVMIVLFAAATLLGRLAYFQGLLAVLAIVLAVTAALFPLQTLLGGNGGWRELAWGLGHAALGTGVLAWYFHLRNRAFSPAISESRLQALNLEQLRLGERLRVLWQLGPAVEQALVPPMLLQPLVENAVYHGIEPGIAAGVIEVRIERRGDRLRLQLSNPYHEDYQHRQGNRMALDNIRERLQLHFDVEASLDTRIAEGRYEIGIVMPYRAGP